MCADWRHSIGGLLARRFQPAFRGPSGWDVPLLSASTCGDVTNGRRAFACTFIFSSFMKAPNQEHDVLDAQKWQRACIKQSVVGEYGIN